MSNQTPTPPRYILRFFRWFCHPDLAKYIEGDLIELYQERLQSMHTQKANLKLLWDVILLLRPGIIRSSIGFYSNNNYAMIKNYLKIGYRNLWKDRFYTAINMFGLSVGLACSFLVLLLVHHEFSYENFYENQDRIFRLGIHYDIGGKEDSYSNAPRPMAAAFKAEYPEIESYTRMGGVNGLTKHKAYLKYDEQFYATDKIFVVDSTFFDVFSTKLVKGQKNRVLNRPHTMVISQSMAEKIFEGQDPIGQKIEIAENGKKLEITGVFEDVPINTHIPYDVLVSWNNYTENRREGWYGGHVYTYLKLYEGYKSPELNRRFPAFFEKYMATQYKEIQGTASILVQPLTDIHLKSNLTWEPNVNGDLNSVYILLAIGIFLVVIAQVNYLNLSLARSSLRKKEISVRMVNGASRKNISNQFIVETMLFTTLAFLLSLLIIGSIQDHFIHIIGVIVEPFGLLNLGIFAAVTFGIGLLVSLYPSMILASSKLTEGLKGKSKATRKGTRLQKALVVFQFAISTIVILFTFVVQNQLDFVLNKDLGFDKENVVVFQLEDSVIVNRVVLIKEKVSKLAGVNSVSFTSDRPGVDLNHAFTSVETPDGFENIGIQFMQVDENFNETIGLEMLKGRKFIKGSTNDAETSVMINETAMKKFGWEDDPIGKKIYFSVDESGNPNFLNNIGVFKNFNMSSLHSKIDPVIIFFEPTTGSHLLVKISANNEGQAIADINDIMNSYAPSIPVKSNFLDVELNRMYSGEERLYTSMTYLSGLTILISILGFIGLLSFSISKREKEIGIRKVLGAKVSDVTFLFYKDIFILVLIGELLAFPINHYIANEWLSSFQYQTYPGILEFIMIMAAIIIFSLMTIGFQIIRVAYLNPADVIKDE